MYELMRRALLSALLMACAIACGKKDESGPGPSSGTSETADASEALPVAEATDLTALVDLIVAEAGKLPRGQFDPAALAQELGKDPRAHFEWVRDNTWWAPYRGLLRGSKGVMLDRVGSNLDRAVLLGDLLRRSGHTVRLAHTELSAADAKQLMDKVRPIPDRRRAYKVGGPPSPEQLRILETVRTKDEVSFQEQVSESKRRADEAKKLVRTQAAKLYAAVKDAANAEEDTDERALAALRDYWWVERMDGGKWIAMDVMLPSGEVGEPLKKASETSEWKANDDAPSIPQLNWHSVQVSVVIERYENGVTSNSTVLETVLRPAAVFDRPVVFSHMPKPWPDQVPDTHTDPSALGNAAVAVREWVPFLLVGDQPVAQSGFTEDGQIIANALSPTRDVAEAGGAGFMSGFGEALGGGEAASSAITAEWIEYEIRVPGEASQRHRRRVFDLLGPVNRAGKVQDFDATTNERLIERYEALLSTTDILLQPCDFSEEYVAFLWTRDIVANQTAIRELARESNEARVVELATEVLGRLESWGPLPSFAFWRAEIGENQGAWFIDRPNVLNYRVSPSVINADRVPARGLMDVATNSIGTRQNANGFEVRVRQGVADTVAEMLTLGNDLSNSANTSFLFQANDVFERGKRIVPSDAAALQSLGWPEDTAAILAQDLDSGFMAITLPEPVSVDGRERVGWWRVSPSTGETIGVMDSGFHAEETEYSKLIELMNALNNFLQTHASRIAAARRLPVLTPGQSLLLRAAVAAERALEAFASSRQPF